VQLQTTPQQQQPPFYGHYTGQPVLASTSSQELEDFVGAKFYCPHALADGNQHIRIREKMLEFSSTVLSALSLDFLQLQSGETEPLFTVSQKGAM